ncbi:hypothetical protein SAMN05216299_110103 [Nitrosospira sp. Nsp14]|nr:hypothetical protein SAMN05216299_110103 [Nitrosospira sp. Nsp14]
MFGIKMRALQKDGGSDLDSGAMFTYKVDINLKCPSLGYCGIQLSCIVLDQF